jgi:DNA helicase HerA-like ATPase
MSDAFTQTISDGYGFSDPSITLGSPLLDGKVAADAHVRVPLAMLNRHGLVAGATGTGKTKTLQLLTDQLSRAGVPVFCADMKGDLTGLSAPGVSNARIEERSKATGVPFEPAACPVEFLSLTGANGLQLRATVSSFGPLLLGRVLDCNDTQQGVLSLIFKYCDDKGLLLLDLPDLKQVLTWLTNEGAAEVKEYGGITRATAGVILRKVIELEQQGAEKFFGEPEFDVDDLLCVEGGRGVVSVLELTDLLERPALFSTFMMWLLASLWRELPEVGDVEKPKLVFFFDEAHLLFDNASRAFQEQIEHVVRLIRSKGVGVFFVTQTPRDVPADVLAQLGNRVQHALRAFTPDDEAKLKATARTFPRSAFYDIPATLTSLGIGEALVTVMSPRGTPTPVVATLLVPPSSLMGAIDPGQVTRKVRSSPLHAKYAQAIDRESAREVLLARVKESVEVEEPQGYPTAPRVPRREAPSAAGKAVNAVLKSTVVAAIGRELIRGVFGVLGLKKPRRR